MGDDVPTPRSHEHLSWITILILVFSMVAPATPRTMLVVSMAAASMDPLGVWLAHLRGVPGAVAAHHAYPLPAELRLRDRGHARRRTCCRVSDGSCARRSRWAATSSWSCSGHGGMGEVWRARHRLLARSAAIKLVRPELLGARDAAEARLVLRRFEREAQATAALSSPHTIELFDYGMTDEGTFYYVMELLAGRDLESLVREFGPLPADRALYLLRQVCHSLADAHARSLVHRDIKPANIYVCRHGPRVRLRQGPRLRPRQIERTRPVRSRHGADDRAHDDRHAGLHGAGDHPRRRRGRSPRRRLRARLRRLLSADRPAGLRSRHDDEDAAAARARAAGAAVRSARELPIPRRARRARAWPAWRRIPNKRPQDAEALFRLACELQRARQRWNSELARTWWEQHLPELSAGPLGGRTERPRRPVARPAPRLVP